MAWIDTNEDGTRYYVRERVLVDGKKKVKTWPAGPSKETAKTLKRKIEDMVAKRDAGLLQDDVLLSDLVSEFIGLAGDLGREPKTIEGYKYGSGKLLAFFPFKMVADVSEADMNNFKRSLLKSHEVNGARIILSNIRTIFSYAQNERKIISVNPCKGILNKKKGMGAKEVARFATDDEVSSLLVKGCQHNDMLRRIVRIVLHCGMRKEEFLLVEKSWVRDGHINLPPEITKTDAGRAVPVFDAIKEDMEFLCARVESGRLLYDWDTKGWRLGQAFCRAVDRSIDGRFRFHDLRHTFAGNYLQRVENATLADLMKIMGHESMETLKIYLRFQKNYLLEKGKGFGYGSPELKVA